MVTVRALPKTAPEIFPPATPVDVGRHPDMPRATAFCPVPTLIVVECGPLELHVGGRIATWYLLSGKRVARAVWGRC